MLVCAYDGSLNGDWVAHYAVRFAATTPERTLRLLHVYDGRAADDLPQRIARIADECALLGVGIESELHASAGAKVADRLLALVPPGPGTMLVAGTRSRPRNLAFLAGTVSARLLAADHCSVVAIRVVHPGVLGQPGRVLLPVAGHPRGARHALPLLRLLGPDLRELHLLLVRELSRLRFSLLPPTTARRLLDEGRTFVTRVEEEVRAALAPYEYGLDTSVVLSDDAPKEILVFAGKLRSRLVCLGASERSLPQRLAYGNPIEQVLRDAPCDVAVYRSVE
ncbi:MAG TPA: universal stress protein [Candidatus Dormibacteraeota bacterium]|nr:universal stress protein [Candidatus Dormibacteraeota bacterium]